MIHAENAAVQDILDDEHEAREYIVQMWAEAMRIYRSSDHKLKFDAATQKIYGGTATRLHAGGQQGGHYPIFP